MEKLLEKMEFNKIKSEAKMEEKVQSLEKKGKVERNFHIVNWVDPNCRDFKDLSLIGSAITAK